MTGCCKMGPGFMGAHNGDLELGKFEPHQFRILYTHINQIMQKNQFQQFQSHRITSRYKHWTDKDTKFKGTLILMLFVGLNISDAFRCVCLVWYNNFFCGLCLKSFLHSTSPSNHLYSTTFLIFYWSKTKNHQFSWLLSCFKFINLP